MVYNTRQAGMEIEVTEEMVRTGRDMYYEIDLEHVGLTAAVTQIFIAMESARRQKEPRDQWPRLSTFEETLPRQVRESHRGFRTPAGD
jgi:hypothetical protein